MTFLLFEARQGLFTETALDPPGRVPAGLDHSSPPVNRKGFVFIQGRVSSSTRALWLPADGLCGGTILKGPESTSHFR